MIHRIVQFALSQRFLVVMMTVFVVVAGIIAFQRMPVDAYPDLSPPMVEVITQWPGHAAEEVERLVTLPIEVEMNGIPRPGVQAVHFALRALRCDSDLRGRHGRLLGAPGRLRALERRQCAHRRDALARSPLLTQRACLSLHHRKSRPLAPGTQDHRGLGAGARLQIGAGCGRRLRLWRHGDAVPGAAGSRSGLWISPHRPAGDSGSLRQQRQRGRRILFAGRAVLLRARAWVWCATPKTSARSSWPA